MRSVVDFYIPDVLLEDYERMAQVRTKWKDGRRLVPIQANVLLGLLHVYREARKQDLQKRDQK